MSINVSFDSGFYLNNDSARINGRLLYDNGAEVSGACVTASLWGGTLLGTAVSSPLGDFSILFTVRSDPGNYTVNITAELGAFVASAELILRVWAHPNSPPLIYEVLATPANVTHLDDVVVCATVTDDHGVRSVSLVYRAGGGNFTRLPMNSTGADRYVTSIPRQPAGTGVEYYVEAYDGDLTSVYPRGAPVPMLVYAVGPGEQVPKGWLGLVALLNCTECFFGRPFLITGFIRNETGGPVAGACVTAAFEGPAAQVNWSGVTDAGGIFRMTASAPASYGSYALRVSGTLGELANSTSVGLRVLDSLTVTVYTAKLSVEISEPVAVTGRVLRSDGSGAANASLRLNFEGAVPIWDTRTDPSGFYNTTVRAPGTAGIQVLAARAVFFGLNATGESRLYVRNPARAGPGEYGPLAGAAVAAAAIAGLRRRRHAGPT
jgi:hypothetical protein